MIEGGKALEVDKQILAQIQVLPFFCWVILGKLRTWLNLRFFVYEMWSPVLISLWGEK